MLLSLVFWFQLNFQYICFLLVLSWVQGLHYIFFYLFLRFEIFIVFDFSSLFLWLCILIVFRLFSLPLALRICTLFLFFSFFLFFFLFFFFFSGSALYLSSGFLIYVVFFANLRNFFLSCICSHCSVFYKMGRDQLFGALNKQYFYKL